VGNGRVEGGEGRGDVDREGKGRKGRKMEEPPRVGLHLHVRNPEKYPAEQSC